MAKTVAGFYKTVGHAQAAAEELRHAGFPGENTAVLAGEECARSEGLTGLGVPPEQAARYEEGLRRGGAIVIVRCEDARLPAALEILERHDAQDMDKLAQEWGKAPVFQEATLEFKEKREEPVVSKHPRVVEEVVVRKEVRRRTETVRGRVKKSNVEVEPAGGGDGRKGWEQVKDAARAGWDKIRGKK